MRVVENVRKAPRQRRARASVDCVLEAAAQVLEACGEDGFNTNAVAERAGVSIGTLYRYFSDIVAALVLGSGVSRSQAPTVLTPWSEARLDAMVRIDVGGASPLDDASVGAGFLVKGSNKTFVLTSLHVLFKDAEPAPDTATCVPLTDVVLHRRDQHGERLTMEGCAWNLGHDLALVPLVDRAGGYPVLTLAAREIYQYDQLYPAGYPNGFGLDQTEVARVKIERVKIERVADDLVLASATTMEGMSGGPYLSSKGLVVGVHTGGVRYRPGYALFSVVGRNRQRLEAKLGLIEDEAAQPPIRADAASAFLQEAGLGSLIALQAISRPQERLDVWSEVVDRRPTAAETRFLLSQPQPETVMRDEVVDLLGRSPDRAELTLNVADLSTRSQAACISGRLTFSEGVMACDGRDRLFPSPNIGGENRPELIVMHYSASNSLSATVQILSRLNNRGSAHFIIDRDGAVVQLIPTNRVAYHVGLASFEDMPRVQTRSIGVELVNLGQLNRGADGQFRSYTGAVAPPDQVVTITRDGNETYWHRFTAGQLVMAERLSRALSEAYPIRAIVGHCTIDPRRKIDPGPAFPLSALSEKVLGTSRKDCG